MEGIEHVNIKEEVISDSEDTDNCDNQNEQPRQLNILQPSQGGPFTNFTIEEILKPDFGAKRQRLSRNERLDSSSILYISPKSKSSKTKHENSALSPGSSTDSDGGPLPLPAWVYCTRYSDRPSSGPRSRKLKKKNVGKCSDDKRPRTAFSNEQLQLLKEEFEKCQYLTEQRRRMLARDLKLSEGQIKIWFQNKRAKVKKTSGVKNILALHLMAQGLYNHSTVQMDDFSMDDGV